ncbi:MAG: SRPBCC family protein [Solirubrobacterales bacterium]
MNFETAVRVQRSAEEVFDYVSEPQNFPDWNSAVQGVRRTSGDGDVGSTYSMERELPGGRAENELEILTSVRPTEFALRTTSGPTPFIYRYRFDSEDGVTVVRLVAEVELTGVASALGPLGARVVKHGVDANFATLKRILEGT